MSYAGQLYYPLKQSQFTLVQDTTHSTGTYTDTQFGVNMVKPSNGNNEGLMTMLQSLPSAPYSIIAAFKWNATQGANNPGEGMFGVCLTDGSTTSSKVRMIRCGNLNGTVNGVAVWGWGGREYSDYATFTGNNVFGEWHQAGVVLGAGGICWMRLRNDNTNMIYSTSADGITWNQEFSESKNTYLTPTYGGVFINPWGCNVNVNVVSFQIA